MSKPEIGIRGLVQVLPYLYMGDAHAAQNKDELKKQGIEYIVNCSSGDVDNFFPDDFKYTSFDVSDVHDADAASHFEAANELIFRVKDEKSNVLVHCTTGKSVAPTFVLAYMMTASARADKRLTLLMAIKFLNGKWMGMQPNDNFMGQLLDVEMELYEENSMRIVGRSSGGGSRGRGGRGGKGKRGK